MSKQQKNGKIELLRFLFSIYILCFHIQKEILGAAVYKNDIHFAFFPFGSMGVEFFFIVSGFLMAASVSLAREQQSQRSLGSDTLHFIKNKFVSLLPMRLIVFVLLFAGTVLCNSWNIVTIIKKLLANIPGFFLVQMSGLGGMYINDIEWYLSAMLLGMFILYPLLRKRFDAVSRVVAPLAAVLILGYMYQNFGRLTGVKIWTGFAYLSTLRALAELCLGIFGFTLCQYLKRLKPSTPRKLAFTFLEAFCWIVVFTMMLLTLPRKYEFYILIFIAVGVICSFSGLSYGAQRFDKKLCFVLGKMSLPIYLCHMIPIKLLPQCLPYLSLQQQGIVCFVTAIVISVAVFYGEKPLSRLLVRSRKAA